MRTAEAFSYEAEQALSHAAEASASGEGRLGRYLTQEAQVWATLALTAATQAADLWTRSKG